jgi:hypothetical protein
LLKLADGALDDLAAGLTVLALEGRQLEPAP